MTFKVRKVDTKAPDTLSIPQYRPPASKKSGKSLRDALFLYWTGV